MFDKVVFLVLLIVAHTALLKFSHLIEKTLLDLLILLVIRISRPKIQ